MKLFLKICQLFILKNIYTQIILPTVYIYKTKPDRFRYGRVIVKMSFQYEILLLDRCRHLHLISKRQENVLAFQVSLHPYVKYHPRLGTGFSIA